MKKGSYVVRIYRNFKWEGTYICQPDSECVLECTGYYGVQLQGTPWLLSG